MLSLASKGAQTHTNGAYSGGAASVYNETGHLALNGTHIQAAGTSTAGLGSVSGQTSIESGGTLGVNASSKLVGTTDLSIIQGQGDITLNPSGATRGTLSLSQISAGRNLTLATRNGNMTLTGSAGTNGVGSSQNVFLSAQGDLNLFANNITLQGSRLVANGALNLTATTGNIDARALQVTQAAAGFTNTYWDAVQLVGAKGVSARAAGNIALDSVIAYSSAGSVNIAAGGNTTIAGKYAQWTVDNRPSNGWYQNERFIWYSTIEGSTGVNISALGGNLTLNATNVNAANGKASCRRWATSTWRPRKNTNYTRPQAPAPRPIGWAWKKRCTPPTTTVNTSPTNR